MLSNFLRDILGKLSFNYYIIHVKLLLELPYGEFLVSFPISYCKFISQHTREICFTIGFQQCMRNKEVAPS